MNDVYILGGAQTDFERNWSKEGKNEIALLREVIFDALEETGLSLSDIKKLNEENRVAFFVGNFIAEKYCEQGHLGALLTLVDSRANLPKEIATQLKDNYGSILKLFNTQIPRAVKTAESTSSGGSVFSYDKSGRVANAYSSFAKEVLNDGKEHTKNATAKVR